MPISDPKALAGSVQQDVLAWRRHLHRHPELSFQEVETSSFVADTLASFGGLLITRPTPTSVMARLQGASPGPVLALRADMDALPVAEENDFAFRSASPGRMHACGHDAHTAMLLGVAKALSGSRGELAGEVRFLFQHAEEQLPGGAQQMVDAGVMEGVDVVLGAHVWATLDVGKVGVMAGPVTAAPDTFRIEVLGRGGHAAQPNLTVDPIAIGAQLVASLQQIASRNRDPLAGLVVSVTRFHAGTADNIIPESAELAGTVRSFDERLRADVEARMEQIAHGVCSAHGAECSFHYERGYRPVVNDPEVTLWLGEALNDTFGADRVVTDGLVTMAGEDFSAYLTRAPGSFFVIGARNAAKGIVHPHHHPRFTVDEDALAVGVQAFLAAVPAVLRRAAARRAQSGV